MHSLVWVDWFERTQANEVRAAESYARAFEALRQVTANAERTLRCREHDLRRRYAEATATRSSSEARFSARFQQFCDGTPRPALRGVGAAVEDRLFLRLKHYRRRYEAFGRWHPRVRQLLAVRDNAQFDAFLFDEMPALGDRLNSHTLLQALLRELHATRNNVAPPGTQHRPLRVDDDDNDAMQVDDREASEAIDRFNAALAASFGQPAPPPVPLPSSRLPAPMPDEPPVAAGEKPCCICRERAAKTVAVPCGHVYSCVTCTQSPALAPACALCRRPFDQIIRFFDSAPLPPAEQGAWNE